MNLPMDQTLLSNQHEKREHPLRIMRRDLRLPRNSIMYSSIINLNEYPDVAKYQYLC